MSSSKTSNYDDRFDKVDRGLTAVDTRFDKVDLRLNRVEERLDKVDARFDKVDKRFEKIDTQFAGVNKQFDKLVAFMIKRFDRIDKILETKADKTDLQRSLDMLDAMIKRQEICDQERLVIGHQLERHDRWMHTLAGKAGIQLST